MVHRSKGSSFVIIPLNQESDESLLNDTQKNAIDVALKQVAQGKVKSHEEAMAILKGKHPKYIK